MRRVVVHKQVRGKRLSRYTHFNAALNEAKRINRIKDRDETNRQIDDYFWDLLRYSDARCIHVISLMLSQGKMDFSPLRLTSYEEFNKRCGRYVVRDDDNYERSHMNNITGYRTKMNHILRRKKPKPKPSYMPEGTVQFTITDETYKSIKRGVQEALERLKFDPLRDFNENTVALTEAIWKIKQLSNKDEPK